MKILIIVNESPWGSSLGVAAVRMVRALSGESVRVAAVYFREEGVYHAQPCRATDNGTPDLYSMWQSLAERHGFPLLVCSSAAQRRMDHSCGGLFQEAGLAEVMELLSSCDRLVTF